MRHVISFILVCAATAAAQPATANLKNTTGVAVGTVTLTEGPQGVVVHASLVSLPPGTHAFHVHQTGQCEPPFTSAGGHFNPATKQHGILNPLGMHAGDLGNIEVAAA